MPEPARLTLPTKVWYLAMDDRSRLRGGGKREVDVRRAEVPYGPLNRFFYVEVGRDFHWVDRLGWTAAHWQAEAERVETWLLFERGTPAGYAELDPAPREDGSLDVRFFGLLEPFRGHGLGGAFLTRMIERAWEHDPVRVTVNTCELDGPRAVPNYTARGFEVVREVVEPRGRSG